MKPSNYCRTNRAGLFAAAFFNLLCLPTLTSSQTVAGQTSSPTTSGTSSTTVPATSAPPATSDPTALSTLTALQTALTAAHAGLTQAQMDQTNALAIITSLPTGQPTLASSTVDAIDKAAVTLGDKTIVASAAAMTALDTSLHTDISTTAASGLPTLQSNLTTALTNASAIAVGKLTASDQQKLTSAVSDSNTAISNVTSTISSIKSKILTSASAGVVNDITAAAKFAQTLADMLQKAEAANPLYIADSKATAATIRTALTAGLHDLLTDEQIRIKLAKDWPTDSAAFTNALASYTDGVQPDLDSLKKGIEDSTTGLLARWDPWFKALSGDAASETTDLGKSVTAMLQTLSQSQSDTTVVATASTARNAGSQQNTELTTIVSDVPQIFAFWEGNGYKSVLAQAEISFMQLKKDAGALSGQVGLLGGYLAGDVEHFVQDSVRLFYFTDVQRLIHAINPNAQYFTTTDIDAVQQAAASANAQLVTEEGNVSVLSEEVNRHQQSVIAVQQALHQANAQLADANNRFQTAQARLTAINRRVVANKVIRETLTNQQTANTTQLSTLQSQQTQLQTAISTATASTDPATLATLPSLQQQLTQNQNQQSSLTQQNNTLAQRIAAIPPDADPNGAIVQQQTALVNQATTDVSTIQNQISGFQNQIQSLTPQLASEKQDLIDAQVRRAGARRMAAIYAQAETEAFGKARDNQPYWFTVPQGLSNDPALRVILYGYTDQAVIYIRGLPRDVERVKNMIAVFDRPAPQARITLYTLQISGSNTKQVDKALKAVDDVLRDLRGSIILVQDKLRDSVNQEVECAAKRWLCQHKCEVAALDDTNQKRLARYSYYNPQVSAALGYNANAKNVNWAATAAVTQFTLPDPVNTTTLGQILFVYSLGSYDARIRMLARFVAQIYYEYTALELHKSTLGANPNYGQLAAMQRFLHAVYPLVLNTQGTDIESVMKDVLASDLQTGKLLVEMLNRIQCNHITDPWPPNSQHGATLSPIPDPDRAGPRGGYPHFFVTLLGSTLINNWQGTKQDELTPNQSEILAALTITAKQNVSAEVRSDLRQIDSLTNADRSGGDSIGDIRRRQYLPLVGWLYHSYYRGSSQGASAPPPDALDWEAAGKASLGYPNSANWLSADRRAYQISESAHDRNILERATARVSAADDMLKRMIIVAEDDMDYFFTSPALEQLRKDVRLKGVEVGVLQRESVLATNREIARVDPRATATLTLQQGTDLLDSAQQLAQIASNFRTAQSNSKLTQVLPLLGAGVDGIIQGNPVMATGIGVLTSFFGDLAARPQSPPGDIYSVTSGNTFKLTPIFEPGGASLRFKFDFVGQTLVQEPDGTTNPDLSHIDRHTVNDVVQLSNLEVREISRFESNAKLGLPETRSGGIPLINQIPGLRDIPILGYYYRRNAQAATRQESIIFAQTSIYPTIADLMDLLSTVPSRSDINPVAPAYLQEPAPVPPAPGPYLNALTFETANPVTGGVPVIGSVMLSGPAKDDQKVTVMSGDNGIVRLLTDSIVIPKGQTSAVFALLPTAGLASPVTVTIIAKVGDTTKIALLTVQANTTTQKKSVPSKQVAVKSMVLNISTVPSAATLAGEIILTNPAPKGGAEVFLSTDSTLLTVPPSVIIAAGETTSRPFLITAHSVTKNTIATITAVGGGAHAQQSITIQKQSAPNKPVTIKSIVLNTSTVPSRATFAGQIILTGPAPTGGAVVFLSADSTQLAVPPSVTIAAGQTTSVPFLITAQTVLQDTAASITAIFGGGSVPGSVMIRK